METLLVFKCLYLILGFRAPLTTSVSIKQELIIVTWATRSYYRSFISTIEHNRRWAERFGIQYRVDVAEYFGILAPPRQRVWGKVIALRRALDDVADSRSKSCNYSNERCSERSKQKAPSSILLLGKMHSTVGLSIYYSMPLISWRWQILASIILKLSPILCNRCWLCLDGYSRYLNAPS